MASDKELRCLFSVTLERAEDDEFTIRIPESEIDLGSVDVGSSYRVGIFDEVATNPGALQEQVQQNISVPMDDQTGEPPVEEGAERTVTIENLGEEGDGIAKVDHGFVIMVPDTDVGEKVRIRITDVRENVGFGEVLKRLEAPRQ